MRLLSYKVASLWVSLDLRQTWKRQALLGSHLAPSQASPAEQVQGESASVAELTNLMYSADPCTGGLSKDLQSPECASSQYRGERGPHANLRDVVLISEGQAEAEIFSCLKADMQICRAYPVGMTVRRSRYRVDSFSWSRKDSQ